MPDDVFYLTSILRMLRQIRSAQPDGPSLTGEVLADNIDWLDCYIERVKCCTQSSPTSAK